MKICDVCHRHVDRLESGPVDIEPLDVCGDCRHALLQQFSKLELRVVEIRQQMRIDLIAEWRRTRSPQDGITQSAA